MLLVRLLAAPAFDVFGVGDDDQVIYGHAGASPRFLTDFASYFPGADEHALEVNYRCPAPVVDAARHLLTRNRVRVPKTIRAAGERRRRGRRRRRLRRAPPPAAGGGDRAGRRRAGVAGRAGGRRHPTWRCSPASGRLLLAPHVALVEAGIPVSSILRADILGRTGLRAALAYVRIAAAPDAIDPDDLAEVHRRPSRGLPRWIDKWLARCRSIDDVVQASQRIDDAKVSDKLADLAVDLAAVAAVARDGTTRAVLEHVRDEVGLAQAVDRLDATGGGEGQSHRDDLDALLQVADLHPDPAGFTPWLRAALARPPDEDGVTLSTVHRVKGREWPRVAVFGASDGVMPHRLAQGAAALEEERRVFHVAITRGIGRVAVLADASRPSPVPRRARPRRHARRAGRGRARPPAPTPGAGRLRHGPGPRRGRGRQGPAAHRVGARGRPGRAGRCAPGARSAAQADGVPAYVVLNDRHLVGIAERRPATTRELAACPGIGPAKLAAYGDELLALVAAATATGEPADGNGYSE